MTRRRRWGRSERACRSGRSGGRRQSSFRLEQMGRRDRPIAQLPSIGVRVAILGGIAVAVFAVILFRLWFLQILTGEQYVAAANNNRTREVTIPATRGAILDRKGVQLVSNEPRPVIGIRLMNVPKGQLEATIARLSRVIGKTPAQIREQLALHTGYEYTWLPVAADVDEETAARLDRLAVESSGFRVREGSLAIRKDLIRGRKLVPEATALAPVLKMDEARLERRLRNGRKRKSRWIVLCAGLTPEREQAMRERLLPFMVVDGEASMKVVNILEGRVDATLRRAAGLLGTRSQDLYAADGVYAGASYSLVGLKTDPSKRELTEVEERSSELPGVEVERQFRRGYLEGTLAEHVLGGIGEISGEQLQELRWKGRKSGDIIGTFGVEYAYDRYLRGKDGTAKVEVDALGRPKRTLESGGRLPVPGSDVVLTLDAKVQRAAERALINGLSMAHEQEAWKANGGAAIAMDAENGEILAMASYPTYKPDVFDNGVSTKEAKDLYSGLRNTPLLNRAIQGVYPPGSTYKLITAITGMEAGIISPYSTFLCPGYLKYDKNDFEQIFKCWIHPDGHGSLNLPNAIAQSCDVYFYNVGYGIFGRDDSPLYDWSLLMGLGRPTGIDIPGEYAGLVPTPEWRRKHYKTAWDRLWRPGDSILMAIGQGDLQVTPLQMAVAYAAIANGGHVVTPHLGRQVKDATGRVAQELRYPVRRKLEIPRADLQAVRTGLRMAAASPVGTSAQVFAAYPIPIWGKTGTAEWPPKDDIAWYASYGTAKGRTYVVVVMIEQGGHGGSVAAPAARQIYDALFGVKSSPMDVGPIVDNSR